MVDTVFVQKETQEMTLVSPDTTEKKNSRERGWAAEVSYAALLSDFTMVYDKSNYSFRNFSIGADVIKTAKRFQYSLGLRYTQFNDRYMQQDVKTTGGYYEPDTVDVYYTVSQTDTSWFYVMDSTWLPLESYNSTYEITNRLAYFELSAAFSYDFYRGKSTSLYAKVGGQLGLLVYNEGVARLENGDPNGVNFKDIKFETAAYSMLFGLGIRNKINEKLDLNAECYYLNYFNKVSNQVPNNNNIRALGIKLGLRYYF